LVSLEEGISTLERIVITIKKTLLYKHMYAKAEDVSSNENGLVVYEASAYRCVALLNK
jgi:hypothetical protein